MASLCAQMWQQVEDPRRNCFEVAEEVLPLLGPQNDSVEREFSKLAREWRDERHATSSTSKIAMHPAYQKIVGLGPAAIPLILRELQKELDHWFWALEAITRENPVPEGSYGRMAEMAAAWLKWGREKGYVR